MYTKHTVEPRLIIKQLMKETKAEVTKHMKSTRVALFLSLVFFFFASMLHVNYNIVAAF